MGNKSKTTDKMVLIHPFSNGKAKNYPNFHTIAKFLRENMEIYPIIQLGSGKDEKFDWADWHFFDLPLDKLAKLLESCSFWISVDSFIPHLCQTEELETLGIVIWGPSDPKIFGYDQFINLTGDDPNYTRDPYLWWKDEILDIAKFPSTEKIINKIKTLLI